MKHIKTLTTILLLAIFAFTSCSKDEINESYEYDESLNITLVNNSELKTIKGDNILIWNKKYKGYKLAVNTQSKLFIDPKSPIYTYNGDEGDCTAQYYNSEMDCFNDPVSINCCEVPGMGFYTKINEDGYYDIIPC